MRAMRRGWLIAGLLIAATGCAAWEEASKMPDEVRLKQYQTCVKEHDGDPIVSRRRCDPILIPITTRPR